MIAAKLSARGLSWGCSFETDATGRVLYTADAFSKDGKQFTVLARLKKQESQIQKVIAQIELSKATPKTVAKDN